MFDCPAGGPGQFEGFRREEQPREQVHLWLRTEFANIRAGRKRDPGSQGPAGRVKGIKEQPAELESRAQWSAADLPVEMALGPPRRNLVSTRGEKSGSTGPNPAGLP